MECLVKKVTRLFVFICVNSITFVFTLMTAGAAEQFASGTFTDSQFEAGAVIETAPVPVEPDVGFPEF